MLRRSSAVVGAITTAKSDREDQTEYNYTPESLHTLAVLESRNLILVVIGSVIRCLGAVIQTPGYIFPEAENLIGQCGINN